MTKKEKRKVVYDKYNGHCYLCGCELNGTFHIDELLPVRRNFDKTGKFNGTYEHPERLHIDNQYPACPSCNINKHSMSLEEFRGLVTGFMKHLNEINTQYKIAKRYGLVEETAKPVVFYFEKQKGLCECGEPIDKEYDPCCSYRCWSDKFDSKY